VAPWYNGQLHSPGTGTNCLLQGGYVSPRDLLDTMVIMTEIPKSQLRILVVGGVLICLLNSCVCDIRERV
jgi:hypothetical protein